MGTLREVRGGDRVRNEKLVIVDNLVLARKLRAMQLVNQAPGASQAAS
jgi:hypothetical protein